MAAAAAVAMETFKCENAKLFIFPVCSQDVGERSYYEETAVFGCRCEISFRIFCKFHHIGKLLYTSLNLLPWKQNSLVIPFLLYLFLKGIIQSKIIIYFAYAYEAQDTTDSNDNIAKFTEFPK